ncbi:Deoxyuridine 5'-triphosphate nucleotidohydrolase [Oligella urethralis]|uniref:dUTP diphosphatase n=1 Tax=Oligella urethralis TaxID=90245 RepID=UPI000E0893DD|nr:dUTP diphosphatase [Oligella urethralis]SUA63334.1 Deoxyuridine 5'-triphosphate nucleotidohydrolase [Oligella urethralis]
MKIKPLISTEDFIVPTKGTPESAGFDIYMPEAGHIESGKTTTVSLGFASDIPPGFVALIFPRSGVGFKHGLELNNTCGVIDSDYRGEWKANLRLKNPTATFRWEKGERLLQFLLVPIYTIQELVVVDELEGTERGDGGFGSTGK